MLRLVILLVRTEKLRDLSELLPKHIMEKIISIPIPLNNTQDKIMWNDENYSVKRATWANNDRIHPQPKANMLNLIWKLNLNPKKKLFAWKLI